MTLDKAIKQLANLEQHPVIKGWLGSREALKLGIEALEEKLKREKEVNK